MKRIAGTLLLIGALCAPALANVPAPPPEIRDIPVTFLVDLGSGQVLEAREPDRQFLPASITKVMTAYVAFEEMKAGRLDPRHIFTVSPATASQWKGRGTSMYLSAGEKVSTHNLLRGIMTASANDGAVALAEGHAGSVKAWTFLMNDAARRLGMTRSHYNTPNGWPDGGQTVVTARDLVRLSSAMIRNYPSFYRTYSGRKTFTWNRWNLSSHDPVTGVVAGADGIKTGFTREAGYNFLGSAERNGRRLIMVVAGAKNESQRAAGSRALLEWGFSQWQARPLFAANQSIASARIQGGSSRTVGLEASRPVYATIPRGGAEPVSLHVRYIGPLKAPIRKGQRVAELEIRVGSMEPGRIPLQASEDVDRASPMDRIINGFMNLVS